MVFNIRLYYNKHFPIIEPLISLVIAVGFSTYIESNITVEHDILSWLNGNNSSFFQFYATISATLMGFILTAVSVQAAFFEKNDPRLTALSKSPHYNKIFNIYFIGIAFFALLCVASIIAILGSFNNLFILYVIIFLSLCSIFSTYRTIWIIFKLSKLTH